MNQGKGIFLIRSRDELLEKLGPRTNTLGRQGCFPAPGRVIQRYPISCNNKNLATFHDDSLSLKGQYQPILDVKVSR